MNDDDTKRTHADSDAQLPATVTFVPADDDWTFVDEARPNRADGARRRLETVPPADDDLESAPTIPGYTIVRRLGSGSYGDVWEATDDKLAGRRRVAVKCFTRHSSRNVPLLRGEVERLLELSTDSRIVRLYDVGWEHDPPYFVMEHLAGGSLAQRLRNAEGDAQPLDPDEATRIARDIAKALAYLHSNAIIHCDVKPANVLLNEHGQVRLADFGQSRLRDETGPAYGTLFYMPPEQIDPSTATDVRVDVYALGAVLYEMLTGHPPFATSDAASEVRSSDSPQQRIDCYIELVHREAPATDHRAIPGVDGALADLVDRCLELDPDKRFGNMQQVRSALSRRRRMLDQRPILRLGIVVPLLLLLAVGIGGAWLGKVSNEGATRALLDVTLTKQVENIDFVSRTIKEDLRAAQRRVLREANQVALRVAVGRLHDGGLHLPAPTLPVDADTRHALAEDPARAATQAQLVALVDRIFARYDGRGFYSWVLADRNGWIWARGAPTGGGDVIGRWFGYREWWSGLPQPEAGAATDVLMPGRRAVGLTAPFRSQARGNPMLVSVAAPIWPPGVTEPGADDLPIGVLSASMSLDNLDLLFGSREHGPPSSGCPSSFVTLLDRGALVRHPCADRADLPLAGYGQRTGLLALADRYVNQDLGDCTCTAEDEAAYGKPACCHLVDDRFALDASATRYLAVATVVDPRFEDRGITTLPGAAENGWVVVVQENLESNLEPIRRLGRRFNWLVGGAVIVGLLLIALLWAVLLRTADALPGFARVKRSSESL